MIEFIALFCSGTFFGAAVYVSIVQHPASLDAGGDVPGKFFPPMYRRAAPMQVALAVAGTISALVVWIQTDAVIWVLGALALFSVIPITLLVIKPINDALLSAENDPESPKTSQLLLAWGIRHWLRSIASGVAFVLFLMAVSL